jgi:hypothetical protein
VTRKPQLSDWADLDHLTHFPYVDVATCDASALAEVRLVLRYLECPRRVRLAKNGHVDEVIAAVLAAAM